MRNVFALVVLTAGRIIFTAGGGDFNVSGGIGEVSQMGINFVQPTIQAMEQYKKDSGRYPKDALELVPKHLPKVSIVANEKDAVDETKYNFFVHENLRGGVPKVYPNENSFSIEFIPIDDKFCLIGINNLCEYSSQT